MKSELSEIEVEILRRMTPQQRMRTGISLYHFARRLKLAALRMQHPESSEADLKRMLSEAFLYAHD
ncbi:MAG TPA: hypothetical protein VL992_16085 [Tepidisphaeraceae bacterium]|nr:hypothetical protein [Tepidisphaeraceae bacterium]